MANENNLLGDLLVKAGCITEAQLCQVLDKQKRTKKRLGELLLEEGLVPEKVLLEVLEFQMGIPHIVLEKIYINPVIPRLINENLAKKHMLLPFRKDNGRLQVAMADPLNIYAIDDVKLATGLEVEPLIASVKDILNAVDRYYGKQSAEKAVEELKKQYEFDGLKDLDEEALAEINNAPMVRLVNSIIRQAVKAQASDIHIEPFENQVLVRLRTDGDLQEAMTFEKATHSAMVTRIKIMGKMDIAEKRLPQDGRVETEIDGKEVDLRISSLPTIYGEKIVIRLLNRGEFLLTKKQLGFRDINLERFERIIQHPTGIILVTGPTGSGKSTTLYTILMELNKANRNIITIEDPVEYRMTGVNQVQVNNKSGLTFASGLRSILRQDPDIIMIGEIRDMETAQIAVRAAITGHMVLSTMHTNDTASTINRLMDMGIESYLISSVLAGVVAQRLIKRICPYCKENYKASPMEQKLLDREEEIILCKGTGCPTCNKTGYKGRTTIAEIMINNKEMKALIDEKKPLENLRKAAVEQGMVTLRQNCIELVLSGITTVEELVKNTYSFD